MGRGGLPGGVVYDRQVFDRLDIGSASIGSIYGAAGSLVVVLVWTYYSSQILFFDTELIRAYFDPAPIVPTEQPCL